MNRLLRFCAAGLVLAPGAARAQQAEPARPPAAMDSVQARTLAEAFGRGQWHERVRNYFMATLNQGEFFWANLASSDLASPDPATGAVCRYEVGLFDVSEPGRRQLNASLSHPFGGWARGLRCLYKGRRGDTYGEARYVVNKVNLHLLNFLLNYDL